MTRLVDEIAMENARNTVRIEGLEYKVKVLQKRLLDAAQLLERKAKIQLEQAAQLATMTEALDNLVSRVEGLE